MEGKKYTRPLEDATNHIQHYPPSESTVASIDEKNSYGYQDTYGEAEANQVSVKGTLRSTFST